MIITEGRKHRGEQAGYVILSDPYYVKQLLDGSNPDGHMPELKVEVLRLIEKFDRKNFKCQCRCCGRPVRLLAFYKGTLYYEAWCAVCEPGWLIKDEWQIDVFNNYVSAIDYAAYFRYGDKHDFKQIIRVMAHLKGLSWDFGVKEAVEFFDDHPTRRKRK